MNGVVAQLLRISCRQRIFQAHIKNLTVRRIRRVSRRQHLPLTPCEYMRRPICRVDRHSLEMPKRSVWDGTFIVEMNRRLGWAHE